MAKSNWKDLARKQASLMKKLHSQTKEYDDNINEEKKHAINVKRLQTKESLDRLITQINWANNYLSERDYLPPSGEKDWLAEEIIKELDSKKRLPPRKTLILNGMLDSWRQVKKGPIATIEVTPTGKNKLEKLARKANLTMKDYTTELILSYAKNEEFKIKYESSAKQITNLERSATSSKLEEQRANEKILELIVQYEILLKETIEFQVRNETHSGEKSLSKLTEEQQNSINKKYNMRLAKCQDKFLLFLPNKLKLRDK